MDTAIKIALCAALFLANAACTTTTAGVKAPAPKSFAIQKLPEDDKTDLILNAVSHSGVTYRVRKLKNEPKAKLGFLRERLQVHLEEAGYVFKSKKELKSKGQKGWMMDFIAPTREADYQFTVGIFVKGEDVIIAEAAGDVVSYKPLRKSIGKAISSIKLRSAH